MNELKAINDLVLADIKKNFEVESTFNLWFGVFELRSLTDKKAVFFTSSSLKKDIINSKYISFVKESLLTVMGFSVEVEINCPEENASDFSPVVVDNSDPYASKDDTENRKREINSLLNSSVQSKKRTEYTFDNFIEGESNKFVKASCMAVAKEPNCYNPLFIHGHSGLGKTHLLFAIINELMKNDSGLKIVYKTCEDFMNEMIEAIKESDTYSFKEKYRSCDVLLIDDIQFLAGKESTQEEFFHTFSSLYEADKQIILTSDRPPKDIRPLEDRIKTRFEMGLIAEVYPPSFELRTAIIKKKSDEMNLLIPTDLVYYMAERLSANIRQIEGVLKRLNALNSLSGILVTKESIDEAISYIDPGNIPNSVLVEKIISKVSKHYGVSIEDIKSKRRTENVAYARHIAIYIIKKLTDLSLKEIGNIFERDHSTALASISKIELDIKTKKNLGNEITALIKEIKD